MQYTANYQFRKPVRGVDEALIDDLNYNADKYDALINASQNSICEPYDENETYNTGDCAMHDGLLYECQNDGVTGAWDANDWERTTAAEHGGGGGGNADYIELTQAEYDELTPEEQMNGKLYFITDGQGEGDAYFYPIIYSTEEREVGVWINNKPLYAKSVDIAQYTATLRNTEWANLFSISNIELLVKSEVHYNSPNTSQIVRFQASNGYIQGASTSDIYLPNYGELHITFYYTKTTDTAGSGKYNTLGVPAVHYSTDEQIIGTWLDGNPLYQKSISFDNTSSANLSIDVTDLHIDKMIEMKVWNKNTGYQVNAYYDSNTDYINAYFDETGYVHIRRSGTAFAGTGYITIQYTKSQS